MARKEEGVAALEAGDVITSFNGKPILDINELRGALHELAGKPAVLQIERRGQFLYIEREIE